MHLLRKSIRALPLAAGLLVLPSPAAADELTLHLKHLLFLALLLLAVSNVLDLVLTPRGAAKIIMKKHRKIVRKTAPGLLFYAKLLFFCFVIFACLQLLRLNLSTLLFGLVLVLLLCKSIEKQGQHSGRPLLRLPSAFFVDLLAGLFSFQLLMPDVLAPLYLLLIQIALFLCTALACMTLAVLVAEQTVRIYRDHAEESEKINRRKKPAPPPTKLWRRLHAGLTLLGPALIGIAVARGLFPMPYQLALVCILTALPLLTRQHEIETTAELPENFVRQSVSSTLLFAALILLAGMMPF